MSDRITSGPERSIEILAPAGSYDSFRAALSSGADAVYAGGTRFGARAYAENFTDEELIRAVGEAHLLGRRFYLTVNTLLKEEEIGQLYDYLAPLYEQGLDAVIVQDMGVLEFVRKYFPGMDIHASTQMTITGVYGAEFLESQGAARVVPARELSLEEIRNIRRKTELEIECFVHGALCYCYSGQCLMSSLIGGRSGNRGQCAQPCRLPYTVGGKQQYYLSLKDICTLELIPDLIEAGVCSFKIEGRMKKPEYVAGVTSVYRKYTDLYLSRGRKGFTVRQEDREMLLDLYNRGGFSEGYYRTHNGREMLALDRPGHSGVPAAKVMFQKGREIHAVAETELNPGDVLEIAGGKSNYTAGNRVKKDESFSFLVQRQIRLRPGTVLKRMRNEALLKKIREESDGKNMQVGISGSLTLRPLEHGILTVWHGEHCFTAETEEIVQKARTQPTEKEQVLERIQKTGGSEFFFRELELHMEGDLFLPVRQLNLLKRRALEGLKKEITASFSRKIPEEKPFPEQQPVSAASSRQEGRPLFSVLAGTREQLEAVSAHACRNRGSLRRVYAESALMTENEDRETVRKILHGLAQAGAEIYIALPHIFRDDPRNDRDGETKILSEILQRPEVTGALIRNCEEVQFLRKERFDKKIILDHNLYVFNQYGKAFWKRLGITGFTAPVELNQKELGMLGTEDCEMIVYGFLPVMLSAQCVQKTSDRCVKRSGMTSLTDRYGNEFPVRRYCDRCYNVIYNTAPLYLGAQRKLIRQLAPECLRIQFSVESGERAEAILKFVQSEFLARKKTPETPDFKYTQGHFKRGIL